MNLEIADRSATGTASANLPQVVRQALAGNWPVLLRGPEIVDVIILIESGMDPDGFAMWREDEWENATWEPFLSDSHVARLTTLRISDVVEPEFGCADQEHAVHYSTLTTKAPPIIVEGRNILDGNHRLEAARLRGEAFIIAYVISVEMGQSD